MKLLMVAIVLCASVAAVPHMDAAQSESSLAQNLRTEDLPMSAKEFKEYFDNRLHRTFAGYGENAMSDRDFSKLMESRPFEKHRPWTDVNLLRRPAFVEWINKNTNDKDRVRLVYEKLKRCNNVKSTASIINAGKMVDNLGVRAFANSLEEYMLSDWHLNKGWSLIKAYMRLELYETGDEDVLFTNPAFTTWIAYAIKRYDKGWRKMISLTLKTLMKSEEPDLKLRYQMFHSRRTVQDFRSKLDQLLEKRNRWHIILHQNKKKRKRSSP